MRQAAIAKLLIPADDSSALAHAFFQRAGLDGLRDWLAAFAPGSAEGMQLAGSQGILQAELERIEAQAAGDLFHVALDRPVALRNAIAAEGTGRWMVGVNDICIEADVGRLAVGSIAHVQRHGFVPGIAGDGEGMAAISAGIGEHVHRIGGDRAILL